MGDGQRDGRAHHMGVPYGRILEVAPDTHSQCLVEHCPIAVERILVVVLAVVVDRPMGHIVVVHVVAVIDQPRHPNHYSSIAAAAPAFVVVVMQAAPGARHRAMLCHGLLWAAGENTRMIGVIGDTIDAGTGVGWGWGGLGWVDHQRIPALAAGL